MFLELLDKNPHPLFIGENPTGVYVAVSWVRSRSSRLSGNASVCALRDDLNNSKEGDSGNLRQQQKKIRFIYLYRSKNRCGQGSRLRVKIKWQTGVIGGPQAGFVTRA